MFALIPSRLHAISDYVLGVLLIFAPWLLGFSFGQMEMWSPVLAGLVLIGYSAITEYEGGVWRQLPLTVHRWCDVLVGVLLLASPFVFGFYSLIWWPHVVFGCVLILLGWFSSSVPFGRGPRVAAD